MMKFPALALCLAATMAGAADAQTPQATDPARPQATPGNQIATYPGSPDHVVDHVALRRMYRNPDPSQRDPYTGVSLHSGERLFYREVLFPDLVDERIVAQQVQDIVAKQHREIAALNALAPRAQTAGYTNVSTVYEHMDDDHSALANFASNWLAQRGYSVPAPPGAVAVADVSPEASVDQQIAMHEQALADALELRRTSRSSTVRGMALWAATNATEHLALLRTLDRDVDMGRRTLSAALRVQLAEPGTAVATNELIEQYVAEERTFVTTTTTAPQPEVHVIEVERIVERPVEVERIVERVVERPVVVERIVERPVYVERIVERPVPSRVAGTRQTTRARARRPAR